MILISCVILLNFLTLCGFKGEKMTEKEQYNLNKTTIKELKLIAEIWKAKKSYNCKNCPIFFTAIADNAYQYVLQMNLNLRYGHRDLCDSKCYEIHNFGDKERIKQLLITWINQNAEKMFTEIANQLEEENLLQKEKAIKELKQELSTLEKIQ